MFASDGASAVEAALKICAQFRNNIGQADRNVFVAFENAYHGDTLGAVSIGFTPDFHGPFQHLIFPAERVPPPKCATCPQKETQCDMRCLNPMKDVLERNRGRLSAVVVESLCQGAAGMNIYPARYLSRLAEMCAANDARQIEAYNTNKLGYSQIRGQASSLIPRHIRPQVGVVA